MKQERFELIDRILDEVLDCPTLERPALLALKCGSDHALRSQIETLIKSLAESEDFIERNEFATVKELVEKDSDELTGKKIGAYRLKKLLGEGGMSAVYLASRIDDFEKQVAVKIIPSFDYRRRSAENFRRERQILAHLEHPNIARILDGGTTPDGVPFIVMEYVDGLPLDRFCRENGLSIKEKLELFKKVCEAVTFAHQNLIVHRDLKPSNIFVTRSGEVKLLDFGIAKLLDADAFGIADNKTFDGNALTLEYASPEQIGGRSITVASDVYGLGVILYELLTETRPHNFSGKSLGEIIRLIETKEPVVPSKIKDSGSGSQNSDLDAVVLKALAKAPSERYQTTDNFCADITNFLENKPVAARPGAAFYRLKKYVRRHRVESMVALLVSFLMIGWLVTFVWQVRSEQERSRINRRTAYAAEMILAANEYENSNLNRLREIVEKYRPAKGDEDLRGFEWYFLNNLLDPPSKLAAFRHPDEVWNAEFSPDGKFIASACNDSGVRLWNIETGEMRRISEQKGAWKVSFYPDGKRLAVASSSNSNPIVKIYEISTGKEVFTLEKHTKRIRALDVSPDGKSIATGGMDGNVIIWNAESGAELRRFSFSMPDKNIEFYDVRFSKSGDRLVVSGFETFAVFDTRTWQKRQLENAKFIDKNVLLNAWKIQISPLGKTIALGMFTGEVVFLDAETLQILRVLKLHQANVKSLAFSADGKILATASWDRTVKFVDVQTGEILNELRAHFAGVHEIAISPDGKTLATASGDFYLNLWNTEQVSKADSILTNASIAAFDAAAENAFVWSNSSSEITGWDLKQKQKKWTVKPSINAFSITAGEQKNRIAFGERDGIISIFDSANGTQLRRIKSFDKTIFAIAFAPDGQRLYAADEGGSIKSFDAETGAEIFAVKAHADIIKALSISPDGKYLASGGNDKAVKIFDALTGREIFAFGGNSKPLYKTVFSPDGKLLAATGADDRVRLWNVGNGKLWREFSGMSGGIFAVCFSPDGKRLATASDVGTIRLWDIETGEQVLAFTAGQTQINLLKFSADGSAILSLDGNGKISVWAAYKQPSDQ